MTNRNPNFSRRGFLKTSAAAVSAAAVMASLGTNFAHAAGSDRIKVGLIGAGNRGRGAALDAVKADPAVQIVAIGDLFPEHGDEAFKRLGENVPKDQFSCTRETLFTGFDAYKRVIASDVNYIIHATPVGFRPQHFKEAVEAGKHVFFEKPCAVDPVGVRLVMEMSDVAKQKKLAVVSGTVFRHHTTHREAIRQIHDGMFGDIVGGTSYYNVGYLWHKPRQPEWSDTEWQIRNWLYFTWLSGDHIVEQNVHRIDIMNWVMKNHPVSCYGMGGRQVRTDPMYGNIFDHFAVEYEYPGGVRITNQCRQIDGTDFRVTEYFVGNKSKDPIEPSKGPVATGRREKPEPLGEAYVREHGDMIKSIRDGTPLNEGHQIAESTLSAIMGRMSAYTGKTVTWEAAMNSKLDLWPKEPLAFGKMQTPPVAVPGKDPLV
jgi:predicted dehydrogenase